MDAPQPDSAPDDQAKKERRARLLVQLDEALALALHLNKITSETFPDAARVWAKDGPLNLAALSVDEKLALGTNVVGELSAVAFNMAPTAAMDQLEGELANDASSRIAASETLAKAMKSAV